MEAITIKTSRTEELVDITREIERLVAKSKVKQGICIVFAPHTTAAITINENADTDVQSDILKGLKIIPERGFSHIEGNSPAHIKTSLLGCSEMVLIENNTLCLGTWQGIYLAEFDGPRSRRILVKIISG